MANCYYSYSFDLDEGLIKEESLGKSVISPMRAVGCAPPIDFDDYVDVWKRMCYPAFQSREDERKLTHKYLKKAYKKGLGEIVIDVEHNPMKNTYYARQTRVRISFHENADTKGVHTVVEWEDISEPTINLSGLRTFSGSGKMADLNDLAVPEC